jgi:hypothetical protein
MQLYRYVDRQDTDGLSIWCSEYLVLADTPRGYWINSWGMGTRRDKWVSGHSVKRFAYPTKEEAMVNFKARKARQIKILTSQLSQATDAYAMAKEGRTRQMKVYASTLPHP